MRRYFTTLRCVLNKVMVMPITNKAKNIINSKEYRVVPLNRAKSAQRLQSHHIQDQ